MSKGTLVKSLIKGSGGGGGGSIGTGAYNVKVIDYDGTIIAEQNLDEGKTFKLPKAPSHEGLVFQEWSCSEQITNGKITIGKNDVMIGAIYTTASGKNEFDIELTTVTGLSVTLNIDGDKDWGDGTTDNLTSHTYSQVGKYTIKCDGTTITNNVFGQDVSSRNYYCKAVRIATIKNIINYAFSFCTSLQQLTLSNEVEALRDFSFGYCYSLTTAILPSSLTTIQGVFPYSNIKNVVIPYGLTTIGASMFSTNYAFEKIIMPNTISSVGAYAFNSCRGLSKVKISSSVTSMGYCFDTCQNIFSIKIPKNVITLTQNLFSNCVTCVEYDFSEHEAVPTLQNINNFNGINKICKIKVPSALYEDWIAEANWVTYEDYIVAV